jgi:hypothetical protein
LLINTLLCVLNPNTHAMSSSSGNLKNVSCEA